MTNFEGAYLQALLRTVARRVEVKVSASAPFMALVNISGTHTSIGKGFPKSSIS
jgi:hypothetical protein